MVNMDSEKSQKNPSIEIKAELKNASELPIYGIPYTPKEVVVKPCEIENQIGEWRKATLNKLSFIKGWCNNANCVISQGFERFNGWEKASINKTSDEKLKLILGSGGVALILSLLMKGRMKRVFFVGGTMATTSAICNQDKIKEAGSVAFYIGINKMVPLFKEYTGVDLNEQYEKTVKKIDKYMPKKE